MVIPAPIACIKVVAIKKGFGVVRLVRQEVSTAWPLFLSYTILAIGTFFITGYHTHGTFDSDFNLVDLI